MSTSVLVTLAIQVLLPLAVGLVTKKSTNKHLKTALLAVLTVLNTALVSYASGATDVKELALTAVIGLAISLGTHYGIYKPAGVTKKAQATLVRD